MVTHTHRARLSGRLAVLALILGLLPLAPACDKVPLLAPTGTVITIFPSASSVPVNGEIELVATVIENGVIVPDTGTGNGGTNSSSASGAGTPVHNGTLVTFTTTLGRIEPREARTHNGQVRVRFMADGQNGTAVITAYSGGASGRLTNLPVGSAAAGRIIVTASPQALPAAGGTTEVVARVESEGGTPIPGVPVTFSTTAGSVNPSTAITDANGVARTTLTASSNATVTARAGAQTGEVQVTVTETLGLGLTATPNPSSTGVPTVFAISAARLARGVTIDFGDGRQQSLGDVSSATSVSHVYSSPGNYTATVSGADAAGGRQTATTSVVVGALAVTVTASPAAPEVGSAVTFTANTGSTSVPASRYVWTFDDGQTQTTTGNQTTRTFDQRGVKTVRVDVFGVDNRLIGTATMQINVT